MADLLSSAPLSLHEAHSSSSSFPGLKSLGAAIRCHASVWSPHSSTSSPHIPSQNHCAHSSVKSSVFRNINPSNCLYSVSSQASPPRLGPLSKAGQKPPSCRGPLGPCASGTGIFLFVHISSDESSSVFRIRPFPSPRPSEVLAALSSSRHRLARWSLALALRASSLVCLLFRALSGIRLWAWLARDEWWKVCHCFCHILSSCASFLSPSLTVSQPPTPPGQTPGRRLQVSKLANAR